MNPIDLSVEFAALVKAARGTIDFKGHFWRWLGRQRRDGVLAPLLEDMERHWSGVGDPPSLSDARDLLRHVTPGKYADRLALVGRRFAEVAGTLPEVDVVLLAGLERPEGYSRFEHGRNTIFIGLDHPSALAHPDHLELILAHELCHAIRDPAPAVLADYGGSPQMDHDDFVARHPFREHLVSESLATAVSELAYPGRPDRRYVYFEEEAVLWCEEHRREIAERMLLALARGEPYRTFYAAGSVTPDSPECCDYWFGLHFGRHALTRAAADELLRLPASEYVERYLEPFLADFLAETGARAMRAPSSPGRPQRIEAVPTEEALAGASLPRSVRRVYDTYRALLGRRPVLARRLEEQFAELVESEGLAYAGRPWDVHAFPLLLSLEEERHLRWVTEGLLRLIERVIDLYRTDPEVRAFFGFPRHLEELCLLEPGFRPHATLARFDSYWSGRRLRFLELNVNGTAGWVVAEALADSALELPGLGDLLERHGARGAPLTSRILDGLLDAYRQVRGESAEPRRIAVVDWVELATRSEHDRLAADFSRMGVTTEVAPPERLSFENGALVGPSGPIDLVYRRLTTLDLLERPAQLSALFRAARAGAVVTVGSYASDVAHSKRLFALLTHERWERRFSPEERALIDAHVPWTRMFVAGKTQFEGRLRDLRELARAERERFVLKPAESYEGRGVLLGAETDPAYWEAEVDRRFGGNHVIQERVRAPLRTLLLPRAGRAQEVSRWLHLGEFTVGGQLAGFLARASQELVLTPDSTERTLPCLVLPDEIPASEAEDLGPP